MYATELSPSEIVKYCLMNKIPSIAYTFNEPTIFFEYTYDTAKLANKKGIKNVYVSNGYYSKEAIDMISPYLDAVNIDLKAFTERFYNKICGAKLDNVLESIRYTHKLGVWVEITTLLVPGENDSIDEITSIAKFVKSVDSGIPWHVSAFHPAYKMMDKKSTSYEIVEKAVKIGKEVGLKHVYY
ncbi:MAG TPA: radical SAM protein [Candidatus Dojkabacteria bacterium]|nr:radical SAM protein [Candidatus Dojkabacteria bacterium]HQF36861.1 radical SAM protein [Candidatus Dojkabacteria bacterium]